MTVSSIRVRLPTKFPASVTVSSPILLSQTGGNFAFSLDAAALETTLSGVYAQVANNLSDLAFKYTAKDNLSIHGADIASAATINLETATGDLVDVTGTVTITAVTLSEGHERTVRFTGALTLTNGASLVLPGGANITTVAGDYAIFRGYASGVVRCVNYTPFTVTGTGSAVLATGPTLTGAVINKVTLTAPATSATLTLIDGTTLTGPASSGVAMTLGNTETITGIKTFGSAGAVGRFKLAGTTSGTTVLDASATASGTLTLPAATDTLIGKATADILTNKTFNSTATGNVLQVSGVTVSAGQYPGEPTTGSATAGNVGEYITATVAVGSAVSLSTGATSNITSISLTAGDWDVRAGAVFSGGATTNSTFLNAAISTTTATLPTVDGLVSTQWSNSAGQVLGSASISIPTNVARISISGTTTVFFVAQATFTVSTQKVFGTIAARRVR